jgi:hypothetical protein
VLREKEQRVNSPDKQRVKWKKSSVTGNARLIAIPIPCNLDIPSCIPARQHIDPGMRSWRNVIDDGVPVAVGADLPGRGKGDGKRK